VSNTFCSKCEFPVDITKDKEKCRAPCPGCGATGRTINVDIHDTAIARDGYELKAKRPGQKKPYAEERSIPSYSHSRKKTVHHQRLIDRDNDNYHERVTDYETGEVIHECKEPLSQHTNHGSAKSSIQK
jgi:hypothetical protein